MSRPQVIAIVLASATLYAFVSILVRALLLAGVSVEATVFGRFLVTAVALLLVPLTFGKRSQSPWRARIALLFLGAIFVGVQAMILFSAVRIGPTAPVIFLFFTFPFWVAGILTVTGSERITGTGFLALLLACVGASLVVDPAGPAGSLGLAAAGLALVSAIMYAVFIVATGGLLNEIGRVEAAGLVALGATVSSGIAAARAVDVRWPGDVGVLAMLLVAGAFGTLALLGYVYGLGRAGANVVALVGMWEPVAVAMLAAALLGEELGAVQIAGGSLVVGGLTLWVVRGGSVRPMVSRVPILDRYG